LKLQLGLKRRHPLKVTLLILGLTLTLGVTTTVSAQTNIAVGVYNFPPVASVNSENKVEGLLGDLLRELDSTNDKVTFRIVYTSPKRRHLDFHAGLYDVIFFENPSWGWENLPVNATRPILMDEDVYVALNKPGRDQSFFDNVTERQLVAISGYHYGFAGLSTDNAELEKRFNIEFSHSHSRNLDLIKADRPSLAEVAVVSRSYLQSHLNDNPEDSDRFLVSDTPDQTYLLHIMARDNGPIDATTLEQLLSPLFKDGRYQQFVDKRDLQLPPGISEPAAP